MKRVFAFVVAVILACSLVACGSSGSSGPHAKQIPDLTGEWKQTNNDSEASYQSATISGDTIEIYWIGSDDTKSLYWAGSYSAPTTADVPYTWDSQNDHSKTDSAIMASGDDTKTMTYQNGVLSYDVSAMGITKTVKLEKQ